MSICSAHQEPVEGCPACAATPRDLFPDWDDKLEESERAGLVVCKDDECRFVFYAVTDCCPACGKKQDLGS